MLRRITRLAADRPVTRPSRVEFGMYPFASVAWAWDELWSAVHSRVGWAPDEITPTGDVHAGWGDERCVVTQICGGPLVAEHQHDWVVIGAFSLDVPHAADPAHYRSVLLSRHDRPVVELTAPTTRAVANSADSLSGWISLLAATVGPGGTWPGDVVFTGSHLAGIRALAAGDADLASVDGWSLALIADHLPELVGDLHTIGLGPVVPTPPVAALSHTRRVTGDRAARCVRRRRLRPSRGRRARGTPHRRVRPARPRRLPPDPVTSTLRLTLPNSGSAS